MIKDFRQVTRLKKGQLSAIQEMAPYVKDYCQDHHVFELMFDFNKNINCERLIRHAIGKEDSKNYSMYDTEISHRFQDFIRQDWDRFTQVLADIKTDDDTVPSVIVQAPPVIAQVPKIRPSVRSDKTNL